MESKFGEDFSGVRIHTGESAASAALAAGARAVTVGRDIGFGPDFYEPSSREGRRLIVHELAHVVQQNNAARKARPNSESELEQEAAGAASAVEHGLTPKPVEKVAGPSMDPLKAPLPPTSTTGDVPTYGNLPLDEPLAGSGRKVVELRKEGELWYETSPHRPMSRASGSYDFVVKDGKILAVKSSGPFGHTEAARGGRVSYAGQVRFGGQGGQRGVVTEWSNASGHYAPTKVLNDPAIQAGLPQEKFVPYSGPKAEKGPQLPMFQPGKGTSPVEIPPEVKPTPDVVGETPELATPKFRGGGVAEAVEATPEGLGGSVGDVAVPRTGVGRAAGIGAIAGEVGGVVLSVVTELAIAVAIGLLIEWLKGLIEESQIRSDIKALEPQIQARLAALEPAITELQKKGNVYCRVTFDVMRRVGLASSPEAFQGGLAPVGPVPYDYYSGTTLANVEVSGTNLGNSHTKKKEAGVLGQTTEHYLQSVSTLIYDAEKLARQKENAAMLKKLRRVPQETLQQLTPPERQQPQQQQAPPLLAPPGVQQEQQQFTPLPGASGGSPIREAQEKVAFYKAQALGLVAEGNKLVSSSPEKPEIEAFLHREDAWRSIVTVWKNHYAEKGPDVGVRGMDELLNSDQYGGRLKQIRNTFGG
jgi:hypothetical protein